eukprot:GHRR01001877.1.p1 GENE.GHRR01001877.1~~GHRR01001877.1.p1  ORF type:complete len:393 (+),score=143.33 GHRR01001877.1:139-1179(+)
MAAYRALQHLGSVSLRAVAGFAAPAEAGFAVPLVRASTSQSYATQGFTDKDVMFNLDNTSDPEAEAAIKAFQREQFAVAAKNEVKKPSAEPELELAAKVERKYMAAQIVESGIQNVAVPLSWEAEGGVATLKRYIAQLQSVGTQAGFGPPDRELESRLSEAAERAESAKDLLNRLRPFTSPDYHAALSEALSATEAETGAPVSLDGASEGYKKFASKVKAVAQQHKLPWQLLLPVKQKLPNADDDTADKLRKDYNAWLQAAAVADAKAEIAELQAEATRLLDSQLAKSAEAVKKEQQAALAATARKLEAAKSAPWAAAYKKDLEFTAWFDKAVEANPAVGPKAATA